MLLLAPLGIRLLARSPAGRPSRSASPCVTWPATRPVPARRLAAASLAVGIAATITVTAAAQQANDQTLTGGNLPTNQLIVWLDNPMRGRAARGLASLRREEPTSDTDAPLTRRVVASARSTAVRDRPVAREQDRRRTGRRRRSDDASAGRGAAGRRAGRAWSIRSRRRDAGRAGIRSRSLTSRRLPCWTCMGCRPPTSSPGSYVISSRRDLQGVELGTGFKGDFRPRPVQVSEQLAELHVGAQHAADRRGDGRQWLHRRAGWLAGPEPSSRSRRRRLVDARHRAAAAGITIESRTGPDRGACSNCATTRRSPARWSHWASWR